MTICVVCGFENPSSNRFCGNCGTSVAQVPVDTSTPALAGGERRHVVLMFADVVASTKIASHLDPEEWREVLARYHRVVSDVVGRFAGHVAKLMGDGVLVYFGWPVAHESDSERAARAAHQILAGVAEANQQSATRGLPSLGVRIGIHLGEVVISPSGEVYGDAANLAARVQSVADTNRVVVTDTVYRSFAGKLAAEPLPARELRGFERPVQLYEVPLPERIPGRSPSVPSPGTFVGRERELSFLLDRWQSACRGRSQCISIVGEAGIGKSRLVQELRARLGKSSLLWLDAAGSEIFGGTPFYPVTRLLSRLLDSPGSTGSAAQSRQLQRLLRFGNVDPDTALPALLELTKSAPQSTRPADRTEIDERRSLVLRSLTACLIGAARRKPTILVLEDVHWFDPSTLELIEGVVRSGTDVPLMILLLARPEFQPPPRIAARIERLALERLGAEAIREIIAAMLPSSTPSAEVVDSIARRASGIPLFAEELAQSVGIHSDAIRDSEVPETLAASLNARLDRVGGVREIVQIAAVIGDEFAPELLGAVTGRPTSELAPLLDRLVDMDILTRRYEPGGRAFNFRHALLRDAAYGTLLRSRRRELHERVANTMATSFASMAAAHSEIMARHFGLAGLSEKAAEAWHDAGMKAAARGAHREAEKAFGLALDNLQKLEGSQHRYRFQLRIQTDLLASLQVTEGYSAPRTTEATQRIKALSEKIGAVEQSVAQTFGQWAGLSSAGRFREAAEVADRFMNLARQDSRLYVLGSAHMILMTSRYRLGDLVGAERHYLNGERLFSEDSFVQNPGAISQVFGNASQNAWMLGRAGEARRRIGHAIGVTIRKNSTYDSAFTYFMAAMLALLMREPREAYAFAQQAMDLADRHRYPQFVSISRIAMGRAQAEIDRSAGALDLIQSGVAGMTETGSRVAMTLYLAWEAEALAFLGRFDEALGAMDRAHAFNPEERCFRPELFRIRGELQLVAGNPQQAEGDIREALALAGDMEALGLELRAALSLHRLLERTGRGGARETIAALLAKIGESDPSPDFKEAAATLGRR